MPDFFHSKLCLWNSPVVWCVAVHFLASSISLYEYCNLPTLLLMDIWDTFRFYLLHIKGKAFLSVFFGGHMCALLWRRNCWVIGCVQFSFSGNHPMIFWSVCTNFHLHHQHLSVPIALPPWQPLPLIMPFLRNEFSCFSSMWRRIGGRGKKRVFVPISFIFMVDRETP